MRIIGGKDYYDIGLSMGIDPTVILLREKDKNIRVEEAGGSQLDHRLELRPQCTYRTDSLGLRSVAIVLCGKVYRGALGFHGLNAPEGLWSASRARSFVAQEKKRSVVVCGSYNLPRMTLEDYFTPYDAPCALRRYMVDNKVSILVEELTWSISSQRYFEVNPYTLGHFGFAKAVSPYVAFQEISMWIGGVLGGTSPEIVEIKDDKTLIEGHGFDNKRSFRGPRVR